MAGSILITGATGYLGSILAAKLLAESNDELVLAVRPHHSVDSVKSRIERELQSLGRYDVTWSNRVSCFTLPGDSEMPGWSSVLRSKGVNRIIHAAGCVDYFNSDNLEKGNIDLTRRLVDVGRDLDVQKFAFVSTAFSSGYVDGLIAEQLHDDSDDDPTEYTQTKRRAERIVAESGLPFLIARPSIVMGNSSDGRYTGKRYGVYQLWAAAEKILCSSYIPRFYAIAPNVPVPVVHQDSFQNGFLAAWDRLPDNRVIHLVSEHDTLPTVRDLWDMWVRLVTRPREIHYFSRLADVPMEDLSRQQQVWVELTGVNLDISSRSWLFETSTLDELRDGGLEFTNTTIETVRVCQNRFIAESDRVRRFMAQFAAERQVEPELFEYSDALPIIARAG